MIVTLEILTGVHAGRSLSLEQGQSVMIGRSPDCDLQLWDHRASRRHCSLSYTHEGVLLTDHESTNGTLLNGAPVHVAAVPDGSRICVGDTLMDVRTTDGAPVRKQVPVAQAVAAQPGPTPGRTMWMPVRSCTKCGENISANAIRLGEFEVSGGMTLCISCATPPSPAERFAETMTTLSRDTLAGGAESGDEIAIERLDGFEVKGHVGMNFLGPIYQVEHSFMRRDMLLLFLLPSLHTDPDITENFLSKGKKGARYRHANLVRVFEIEPFENTVYASMDAHGNKSLWDEVKQNGPLTVEVAAKVTEELLRGLQFLHQEGVTHGDLGPGKVLLCSTGEVRLSFYDLFFARGANELPSVTLRRYFGAPECHSGVKPSPASDLYQAGSLLYYALSGKPPQADITPSQLAMALPPAGASDLPDRLFCLLTGTLAKDPRARFGHAGEALAALV